jgi:hypothetical protein
MIEVRRTGEGDPLEFEVVVREGGRSVTASPWPERPAIG